MGGETGPRVQGSTPSLSACGPGVTPSLAGPSSSSLHGSVCSRPGLGARGGSTVGTHLPPPQKWGCRCCLSSGCQSKMHETECLKQEKFTSRSGGLKSKIKVSAGSGSAEDPPPGLYTAAFSPCPHLVGRGPSSSPYKDTNPTHQRPHPHDLGLI